MVVIDAPALPGGPAQDVALGRVLLGRGLGDARELIRIFTPEATAAFSRRDTRQTGFPGAARAAAAAGFVPVVRAVGGRLAAYHGGSVVIDHIVREPNAQAGMNERFEYFAALHASVLTGFGIDARVGELAGEYCPGKYSVNAEGRCKIVGSAQRITRDGWLFSSIFQVTNSLRTREVLETAYAEIGYDLDATTIGAVDDFAPGVTVADVMDALRRSYSSTETRQMQLSGELLEEIGTAAVAI
jgi:octanoyl-[GcvH]:protein N-octanoyltransferase